MNRTFRKRVERLLEAPRPRSLGMSGLQKAAHELFEFQYRQTLQSLAKLTPETALKVTQEMVADLYRATQKAWEMGCQLAPSAPTKMQCDRGCSWCCHKAVRISPLDAIGAAAARLDDRFDYTVQENDRRPCPLLRDGRCSVYAERPVTCRAFHSWNSELCQQGQAKVPMDMGLFGITGIPQEGALEALHQAGLDRSPVILGEAVSHLRQDFEVTVRRWLSGGTLVPALG